MEFWISSSGYGVLDILDLRNLDIFLVSRIPRTGNDHVEIIKSRYKNGYGDESSLWIYPSLVQLSMYYVDGRFFWCRTATAARLLSPGVPEGTQIWWENARNSLNSGKTLGWVNRFIYLSISNSYLQDLSIEAKLFRQEKLKTWD